MHVEIRSATPQDAAALLAIYAPVVRDSTASFELVPPTVEEFSRRIAGVLEHWVYLVAEVEGRPVAYAYGGRHRDRPAYDWSVETSVYVDGAHHGHGIGRRLYEELFTRLAALGYRNAYAGITLPNDPSLALHRALGFADIGVFPRIGYKFGAWCDVAWLHRPLGAGDPERAAQALPAGR